MIARLLISSSLVQRIEEFDKLIPSKNHPDVLYFKSQSKLGIEQARKIKEHFSLKPYSAKGRTVVLEDGSQLTTEAQNALLKTLEELPKDALFILGANSDARFLPTVLSRCEIIQIPGMSSYPIPGMGYKEDLEKLLGASIEERFEFIEKLKEREEFFHSLVEYFHKNLPANSEFVRELLQAEEWQKQNVNIRAILEYLMLVMPKL